jgi:putative nucleotide binding protein
VRQKKYEDFAYVLDVFSASELKAQSLNILVHRDENVIQLLGEDFFTLLEAATPKSNKPAIRSRLYIGKDVPRNILRILRRIGYDDLTINAKMNLESVILKLLEENEERFIDFFNTARPLTPRMHALELIPGIGKKIAMKIMGEREVKPFESYEDLRKRGGVLDPVKALQQRILEELRNPEEKYRLFVRPPVSHESGG